MKRPRGSVTAYPQGQTVETKVDRNPAPQSDGRGGRSGGGVRGAVTELSDRARRKLRLRLGQIDREAEAIAVTLQPPGAPSGEEISDAVTNLLRRLERRFPGLGIVLRYDPSRRKSGEDEGTVTCHIHAVAYGVPRLSLEVALRRHWSGVWSVSPADVESGIYVETVEDFDRWSSYIARERPSNLSRALGEIGRRWTIRGEKNLPWSWTLTIRIPPDAVTRVQRWMEKIAGTRVHALLSADPGKWIRAAILARAGPPEHLQEQTDRRPTAETREARSPARSRRFPRAPSLVVPVVGEVSREQLRRYRSAWKDEGITYRYDEPTTK